MLIDDEGYVKPASRESRLVMIQLEPRAEKETKGNQKHRGKKWKQEQNQKIPKVKDSECRWIFLSVSWKHVAIGKGFIWLHGNSCA